jgi:hypothetical protein
MLDYKITHRTTGDVETVKAAHVLHDDVWVWFTDGQNHVLLQVRADDVEKIEAVLHAG